MPGMFNIGANPILFFSSMLNVSFGYLLAFGVGLAYLVLSTAAVLPILMRDRLVERAFPQHGLLGPGLDQLQPDPHSEPPLSWSAEPHPQPQPLAEVSWSISS